MDNLRRGSGAPNGILAEDGPRVKPTTQGEPQAPSRPGCEHRPEDRPTAKTAPGTAALEAIARSTAAAATTTAKARKDAYARRQHASSMSPLEERVTLDRHSISAPSAVRRFSGLRRDPEAIPWAGLKGPCPRTSLPSCVGSGPGPRPAGLTWLADRFGKRAQSDPWISDRIRRYFLSRRFTVGTNNNALLLSSVGSCSPHGGCRCYFPPVLLLIWTV